MLLDKETKSRLGSVENSATLCTAMILDLRFKLSGFRPGSISIKTAKDQIIRQLVPFYVTSESPTVHSTDDDMNPLSIWYAHDQKLKQQQEIGTPQSRAIVELDRYLDVPLIPRHIDPLQWWKKKQRSLSKLAKISEESSRHNCNIGFLRRLFSAAGLLLTDSRNRLSASKVGQITFFHSSEK